MLEVCYTDLGKTYQILLGEKGSEVSTVHISSSMGDFLRCGLKNGIRHGLLVEKDKYTNKKGNRGRLPFLCFIVVSYVTGDLYDKGKRIANI